jgi:hypothetical protein
MTNFADKLKRELEVAAARKLEAQKEANRLSSRWLDLRSTLRAKLQVARQSVVSMLKEVDHSRADFDNGGVVLEIAFVNRSERPRLVFSFDQPSGEVVMRKTLGGERQPSETSIPFDSLNEPAIEEIVQGFAVAVVERYG